MRFFPLTLFAIVVATGGSARAATIPLQLDITDGVNAQHLVIDAPREDIGDDVYSYDVSGVAESATWRVEWRLLGSEVLRGNAFELRPTAQLEFLYRVYNLSEDTSRFVVVARAPVELTRRPVEFQGTIVPAVTDLNGDGATLTGYPAAASTFYLSLLDGDPFVGILLAGSKTTAEPFGTGGFSTPGGNPFNFPCFLCNRWLSGPSVTSDIGVQMAFSVTGQDLARASGSLSMQQVPEPEAITMMAAMLFMILPLSFCRRKRQY